jgi:purine-binding chemotaxis protein CheW
MSSNSKRLDWEGARARLQRIQESLDRFESPSPEDLRRLYDQRAERLARESGSATESAASHSLMVFRLGDERYAFPISDVAEVLSDAKLAPVPGAPLSVAGVIQVRGEIRPIYNLHRCLGLPDAGPEPTGEIVLIRAASHPFGIRVDVVEEIRSVRADQPRPAGNSPQIAWVTDDLVSVLNTDMLGDSWET